MIGGIEHLVDSGPLLLAMPVALAAGAVTFLSPCCLPLVPGYLSYLTGMSGTAVQGQGLTSPAPADSPAPAPAAAAQATSAGMTSARAVGTVPLSPAGAGSGGAGSGGAGSGASRPGGVTSGRAAGGTAAVRGRAVLGTLLFVLGFSAVFVIEGFAFGSLGDALRTHTRGLTQVLGCVIILLGLLFVGAFDRFTFTGRIFRPQFRPRAGLVGAPLLGLVFGLGWSPCIGPTLGAVLSLGATTGAARGALLASVYALGLGIPFLVVAFAVQRGVTLFGFARRHARLVTQVGGVMLIAVGLLEVTGAWGAAMAWLQVHWIAGYNAPL